jgi:hypothetical protein
MGAADGPLVDVVVGALRYRYSADEDLASRTPPYPVPEPLRPARDRIAAELEARPEAWGNLAAARIGVEATPAEMLIRGLTRDQDITWSDAVCALLATGALDDADLDVIEPELDEKWRPFVMRQRALTRIVNGDIDGAVEIAERMPSASAHRVYRDIGWAAARAGDLELYRRYAKQYQPGTDRTAMNRLRGEVIAGIARVHGLDAAVSATNDTSLGTAHLSYAIAELARAGEIDQLDAAFAGPLAGLFDDTTRVGALIDAVAVASPDAPAHDHPRLAELLEQVLAIDPTTSKEAMRTRDALLFHSWPAIGDQETLARVRAAVRTPDYRRQLTRLKRDIRPR